MDWIGWLEPWEVSPTLLFCFLACGVLFVRGQRVHRVNRLRQWLFWCGLVLL
ncbi:MAG: cytochrome c oxidase assembly protein, partial [Alcaligenaceae bacterium]